jgi:putative ABC transport system permease protein
VNVANLLLARATARQREFAIRAALGAGQLRVIRQLLAESLILASLGGGCGLLLAWWGVQLLTVFSPGNLPRLREVGMDSVVVAFALALTLGMGFVFGLAPAYQAAKIRVNDMLQEHTRGATAGKWSRGFRGLLVIFEVAVSLVLLVGAGLLVNSFIRLLRVDTGYHPERVLTVALSFAHPKYSTNSVRNYVEPLLERVRNVPGVQSAAVTSWIPVAGGRDRFAAGFQLERQRGPDVANMSFVTADYFTVMGIPLLRGRYFTPQDLAPNAPGVKIVSESFARKYFPGMDPLGQRLIEGVGGAGEIVGVVKDTLERGLDTQPEPHIYHASLPLGGGVLVVRTQDEDKRVPSLIRSEVLQLDKDQGTPTVRSMAQILGESVAEQRFEALLLGLFSGIALLLAATGLYGLMAYMVSLSQRDLGIRMALGAQRWDVFKLVVGRGMRLLVSGIAIGTAAALGSTRVLAHHLFGVSASDPGTFAAVSAVLVAVGLLACYIPARRATRLDPVEALKYE